MNLENTGTDSHSAWNSLFPHWPGDYWFWHWCKLERTLKEEEKTITPVFFFSPLLPIPPFSHHMYWNGVGEWNYSGLSRDTLAPNHLSSRSHYLRALLNRVKSSCTSTTLSSEIFCKYFSFLPVYTPSRPSVTVPSCPRREICFMCVWFWERNERKETQTWIQKEEEWCISLKLRNFRPCFCFIFEPFLWAYITYYLVPSLEEMNHFLSQVCSPL